MFGRNFPYFKHLRCLADFSLFAYTKLIRVRLSQIFPQVYANSPYLNAATLIETVGRYMERYFLGKHEVKSKKTINFVVITTFLNFHELDHG